MPRRRPSKAEREPPQALAPGVTLLSLLGLAILCLCTIPAVSKQQRLEREHTRLREHTQALAGDVERLRRELHDDAEQAYLRKKATRALLHQGSGYVLQRDARFGAARVEATGPQTDGEASKDRIPAATAPSHTPPTR